MIKKSGTKYTVIARSGRKMGTYDSLPEANARLKQIEMFRNMREQGTYRGK